MLNRLGIPASRVAEEIAYLSNKPVSPLKLQYLLLYIQGVYGLTLNGKAIKEDFYISQHGIEIPVIFEKYRDEIEVPKPLNRPLVPDDIRSTIKVTLEHFENVETFDVINQFKESYLFNKNFIKGKKVQVGIMSLLTWFYEQQVDIC